MTDNKDRENYTDEQLLSDIRDGDKEAESALLTRYKEMVRIKARSMFIIGGETDDLIQEGMIGLLKAIRDYDFGRDAQFKTFAELCISRQMYTAVQTANRKKHGPLNTYVSFSKNEGTGEDSQQDLLSVLEASDSLDPEKLMIDRENVARIYEVIQEQLSPMEKQVLDLKLTGMNYTQIAKVLGRDAKSTDNALSRIKNKLRSELL
ncbi:MAG: RNA polymerase sporulation sigma factor SigH [Lachnospiraceae bacterium]|nr:RNA polymerase sporulation sigma factor SigH [Lachnospiraceae bacterium]